MTIQRDIFWKQGAKLSELLLTDVSLVGRSLRCNVRKRKNDPNIALSFTSSGPANQRIVAEAGGPRITLGAVAGEGVQTGGNDDRWVFDVEAVLDADPEDVIRTHEGEWIVSADVTRSGTQTPATPDGDLRWLRPSQIVQGSNITVTVAGSGASTTLTFSINTSANPAPSALYLARGSNGAIFTGAIERAGRVTRLRDGTDPQELQWCRRYTSGGFYEAGSLRWLTVEDQHFAVLTAADPINEAQPGVMIAHPTPLKTLAQLGPAIPGVRTMIGDSMYSFDDGPANFGGLAQGDGSYIMPVYGDDLFWRYG
jgi:hypothetical protein